MLPNLVLRDTNNVGDVFVHDRGATPTYAISGQVQGNDARQTPIPGVVVSAGGAYSTTTGPDGRYTISGLAAGAYTLTTPETGFVMSPSSIPVSLTGDITGQDFTVTCVGPSGLNVCQLAPGDFIFVRGSRIDKWLFRLGRMYWTHVGLYAANGMVAEAVWGTSDEVRTIAIKDSPYWNMDGVQDVAIRRPTAPSDNIGSAIAYALDKTRDANAHYFLTPLRDNDILYYCSQFLWWAFHKAGPELETLNLHTELDTANVDVSPEELYRSSSSFLQQAPKGGLEFTLFTVLEWLQVGQPARVSRASTTAAQAASSSPAPVAYLMLEDAQGRRTGFDTSSGAVLNQIPGVVYNSLDEFGATIWAPAWVNGWQLKVTGQGPGEYRLGTTYVRPDSSTDQSRTGSTVPGKTDSFTINDPATTPPGQDWMALDKSVSLTAPASCYTRQGCAFTAAAAPPTVTLPFNYTWTATEHSPVAHTARSAITDTAVFTWTTPGTKTVLLVAANATGAVTATLPVTVQIPPRNVYPTPQQRPVDPARSTLVVSPTSVLADGSTAATITVTLRDTAGDPAAGRRVLLGTSRGPLDKITAATGVTDAAGVYTTTVRSRSPGTSAVKAYVAVDRVYLPEASVTFR